MGLKDGGPKGRASLGDLAWTGSRLLIRTAINQAMANAQVPQHIAKRMYESEHNKQWENLAPEHRALWTERARIAIAAIGETVGG